MAPTTLNGARAPCAAFAPVRQVPQWPEPPAGAHRRQAPVGVRLAAASNYSAAGFTSSAMVITSALLRRPVAIKV